MTAYEIVKAELTAQPRRWLVTGVAGFIGSNLLEELLKLQQIVVGIDNFSNGKPANLKAVKDVVQRKDWKRFSFVEGDITNAKTCRRSCDGAQIVLHQAALGSVPRSLAEPILYHAINVTGFLNMLSAARDAGTRRLVFASSSSVYGDDAAMPKIENRIGRPMSPYAATKWIDEIYAEAFSKLYNFSSIGLRYFNVFGPRQDPNGAYAAVIPRWIQALIRGERIMINGDGETSRDFCFIDNVVQANILAATVNTAAAENQIYNIAMGESTSLNELFALMSQGVRKIGVRNVRSKLIYCDFRAGDIRHSLADINKARRLLGYDPTDHIKEGLARTMAWYNIQRGHRKPGKNAIRRGC